MSALSQKETRRLLAELEKQGAVVNKTKAGVRVLFPSGGSTAIHWTHSDHRATKNLRAEVRRAGLRWPTDHHTERAGKMDPRRERSIAKLQEGLAKLPSNGGFTLAEIVEASGVATANRILPLLGYTTERKPGTRDFVWYPPQGEPSVPEVKQPPASAEEAEPEYPGIEYGKQVLERLRPAEQPAPPLTVTVRSALPALPPKPASTSEREFIDTHDSWTIDVPAELQAMAEQFNLNIECRVWRKDS